MKKFLNSLKHFLFFISLYIFWFFLTLISTSKEQLEKDLPTASALAFFAITFSFLLFISYKVFKFIKSILKK